VRFARSIVAVAVLLAPACYAHVTGTLEIDGVSFVPTWCGSGAPRGFPGVELADEQGRRLRLGQHLDGSAAVALFRPGSRIGETLPGCATVEIRPGTGKFNGTRNLDGAATLSCVNDQYRVVGSVEFKNCH
jgi:hypothetical protein